MRYGGGASGGVAVGVMWCACVVMSVISDKQGSLRKDEGEGEGEGEGGVELTSVSNPSCQCFLSFASKVLLF